LLDSLLQEIKMSEDGNVMENAECKQI